MNLIPTRRGSGQRLNLPLLVGVELANTLLVVLVGSYSPKQDSICVYGGNIPDLVTGVVSLCKRGIHGETANE